MTAKVIDQLNSIIAFCDITKNKATGLRSKDGVSTPSTFIKEVGEIKLQVRSLQKSCTAIEKILLPPSKKLTKARLNKILDGRRKFRHMKSIKIQSLK